jgi:hypothetical protein
MLNFITDSQSPWLEYIKDDPVRPELDREFRVGPNRFVSVLADETPRAIVCVSLLDTVPAAVEELGTAVVDATVAVFYTIWSYAPGAGTEILFSTVERIRQEFPNIQRFVTLSPKTEMARRFHIKNGAEVFRENEQTINYEYRVKS